jgi:Cft2 family RNA processing exonuclease
MCGVFSLSFSFLPLIRAINLLIDTRNMYRVKKKHTLESQAWEESRNNETCALAWAARADRENNANVIHTNSEMGPGRSQKPRLDGHG